MKPQAFYILLGATVIVTSAAALTAWQRAAATLGSVAAETVVPGLINRVNDVATIEVKAEAPFQVCFRDQHPSVVLHNLDIRDPSGSRILQNKPMIDGGKETVTPSPHCRREPARSSARSTRFPR